MPFALPKFHRPAFIKDVPVLNALTSKGALAADGAINSATLTGRATRQPASQFGQYRARVSALRESARLQSLRLPTLSRQTLNQIMEDALAINPSIETATSLRSTSPECKQRIDMLMQRPEQWRLALDMTRNSLTNIARSPELNDERFREEVTNLINRSTHVAVDLRNIASPVRRQYILDCLANATHLHTVNLDATGRPENFAAVLAAIATVIANNPQLTRLELDAKHNDIDTTTAQTLAANAKLTYLNVAENNIGAVGAQALAAITTLRIINVANNNIGAAGAQALAANRTIKVLDVRHNNIGDAGAQALAANTSLVVLHSSDNNIGDAGAQALARNNTIRTLDLSSNQIREDGARALAENNAITSLVLERNVIGDEGVLLALDHAKPIGGKQT